MFSAFFKQFPSHISSVFKKQGTLEQSEAFPKSPLVGTEQKLKQFSFEVKTQKEFAEPFCFSLDIYVLLWEETACTQKYISSHCGKQANLTLVILMSISRNITK